MSTRKIKTGFIKALLSRQKKNTVEKLSVFRDESHSAAQWVKADTHKVS